MLLRLNQRAVLSDFGESAFVQGGSTSRNQELQAWGHYTKQPGVGSRAMHRYTRCSSALATLVTYLSFPFARSQCAHMQHLRWMAPEVFLCKGPYKPSADVFSFALLCSEILSRQIPLADVDQPGKEVVRLKLTWLAVIV